MTTWMSLITVSDPFLKMASLPTVMVSAARPRAHGTKSIPRTKVHRRFVFFDVFASPAFSPEFDPKHQFRAVYALVVLKPADQDVLQQFVLGDGALE